MSDTVLPTLGLESRVSLETHVSVDTPVPADASETDFEKDFVVPRLETQTSEGVLWMAKSKSEQAGISILNAINPMKAVNALGHALTSLSPRGTASFSFSSSTSAEADSGPEEIDVPEVVDTSEGRLQDLAKHLSAPDKGVTVKTRMHHGVQYPHVFKARSAVNWLLEHDLVASRGEALAVCRAMTRAGFMTPATKTAEQEEFRDVKTFYRWRDHPTLEINLPSFSSMKIPDASADCCPTNSKFAMLTLAYAVLNNSVVNWLEMANPCAIKSCYAVIALWAKLRHVGREKIRKHLVPIVEANRELGMALLGFLSAQSEGCFGEDCEGVGRPSPEQQRTTSLVAPIPGKCMSQVVAAVTHPLVHPFTGETAFKVTVMKEFATQQRPCWLRFHNAEGKVLEPDVIGKSGDDLRKDLAVQLIFKCMEGMWNVAEVTWHLGSPPVVQTYQVLISSAMSGFLEFVPGRTVKEVHQDGGWREMNLVKLAPSLVGAFCAAFILGVRDRHWHNVMVVGPNHNPRIMQIDFGFIMLENPGGLPLDTPRMTLHPELVQALKEVKGRDGQCSLLDDIIEDLVTAFRVLYTHHAALIAFCEVALSNIYEIHKINEFLRGRHVFHLAVEKRAALDHFRKKVNSQLTAFHMRRAIKEKLVDGYYAFQSATK